MDEGCGQVIAKPYQIKEIYKSLVTHLDVYFVPAPESKRTSNTDDLTVSSLNDDMSTECDLTRDDWLPLLSAAQSGAVQATEQAFHSLSRYLPATYKRTLQSAIEQFDLGLVESLIAQYEDKA